LEISNQNREFTEIAIALVLQTEQSVRKWKELMGPSSPAEARRTTFDSIRSLYGKDTKRNAVYGSESVIAASDVLELLGLMV
jgi:nucleoside diphosphate kinase